jgi:TrmH family RNA methyltransferase
MSEKITSTNNSKIKEVAKLHFEPSYAKKMGKIVIEGFHLLEMAQDKVVEIYSTDEIEGYPKATHYLVTYEILSKLSCGKSDAKVIAVATLSEFVPLSGKFVLYLDSVQDPGNVGTILRSALAFGVKDVMLSTDCASPYNEKVIQSSQGAIFKLNLKIDSIPSDLIKAKESGYEIIASTLNDDSIGLEEFKEKKIDKSVLVLGNEGKGISDDVLKLADIFIKIPISCIDSLNVAIAAGIILYELNKSV